MCRWHNLRLISVYDLFSPYFIPKVVFALQAVSARCDSRNVNLLTITKLSFVLFAGCSILVSFSTKRARPGQPNLVFFALALRFIGNGLLTSLKRCRKLDNTVA